MSKQTVIVGSGLSGSILARKIAEELGIKALVLEKRPHIAGNTYDELDEHGILIQRYGPHFINTNQYRIIEFLAQYSELFPHETKMLSFIDENYVRLPFNFRTVQQLVGPKAAEGLLRKLRRAFPGRDRVPILEVIDCPDAEVSAYGNLLFEKAYRTYTSKMWGLQPEQIGKYVLDRVPMAMGYDERYLNMDFQYLPADGYTKMFERMLDHPNIEIQLNTDALSLLHLEHGKIYLEGEELKCLIYTGAIDELFDRKYGALPYRSLDIRYQYYEQESVLPSEIVSYPQAPGYVRSTEYRKIMLDDSGVSGSVVATEYPLEYVPGAEIGGTPYYPTVTKDSDAVYQKYCMEAAQYLGLFLCGRLAEFRYYNMNTCIEHALEYFEQIKAYLKGCHV